MGLCFSTRIEAGRALENGENPEVLFEGGNNMNVSGDPTEGKILESPNLRSFSFGDLKVATGDFNQDRLLGIGAFGCVYKGWINMRSLTAAKRGTGMAVAVKMLEPKGTQGQQEWLAEIMHLGRLQHPNLVKLFGHCIENCDRLLVYEFMHNSSLENHLFRGDSEFEPLSWYLRIKVALGAAKGLAFLHNKAHVIHRDFKISDILLDVNFNAKISDFGLAKDGPTGDGSHVTTWSFGHYGYIDPEWLLTGHLSAKSDVYSFGVILLEILTGKPAIYRKNLVEWAKPYLNNKRKVFLILDTRAAGHFPPRSVLQMTKLVLGCLSKQRNLRPDMEEVARELEEIFCTIDNDRSRELGKLNFTA